MRLSAFVLACLALVALPACGGSGASADATGPDTVDVAPPDADDDVRPDTAPLDTAEPADTADTADVPPEVVVCADPACTVADATKCQDPATVVTCVDPDGDGCFDWGEPSPCGTGTVCSNGACAATCASECTVAGATKCEGDGLLTCADRNADGCLEWGTAEACPAGLACSGGICTSTCTSECTFDGEQRCDGDAITTCGDANGDGCFEWGTAVPCAANQSCAEAECLDQCQSECEPDGATTCFANGAATCGDPDADGCLTWGTPVACGEGKSCVDGACTDTPIPEGVRLNEVYYDGPGNDTDSFVELHGPAGTALTGFSVVGVNGADGADEGVVALTGTIGDDGLYVIVQDTASDAWKALADQQDALIDLKNGPDSVQLRFGAVVVDALAYGEFAADEFPAGEGAPARDVQGHGLGRFPDGADTNANAVDFTPQQPTPGAPNEGPDLCYEVTCETPTPAACQDGATLRVWSSPGTCAAGECSYPDFVDVPCADGCEVDHCKGHVPTAAGDVLITEVMPKAAAGNPDAGEWFELMNPGDQPLDLAGCVLADSNPPGVPITASVIVPAHGYVVFAVSNDAQANFGLVAPVVYTGFALSNEGEPLSLTCGGVLVDRVSWTANMVHEGVAMQLSADRLSATANDQAASWCSSTASYGTAGKKGTPGAANAVCPATVTGVTPNAAGQLVVTELMAHSQAGGGDKGEWFELYNASGLTLDLNGCWLADKTPQQFQFAEPLVLAPGAYRVLALSADPAVNFGLVDPFLYSGFSLSNDGEPLSVTCGTTVIDAITYPGTAATEGVAWQLSPAHLDATGNDVEANWCAASVPFGSAGKKGTPGAANSPCP